MEFRTWNEYLCLKSHCIFYNYKINGKELKISCWLLRVAGNEHSRMHTLISREKLSWDTGNWEVELSIFIDIGADRSHSHYSKTLTVVISKCFFRESVSKEKKMRSPPVMPTERRGEVFVVPVEREKKWEKMCNFLYAPNFGLF